MSMALKQSKANAGANFSSLGSGQFIGDPGLFGFIGKALKTATGLIPGPIGTISRSLFPTRPSTFAPISVAGPTRPTFATPTFFPQNVPQAANGGTPSGAPTAGGGLARLFPGGETGIGTGCASGFHPNKTSYFTKEGFVEKGSKCVKNRRRNPLNPRAASRAIGRLESATKATKRITKLTERKTRTVVKCFRCNENQARCRCK